MISAFIVISPIAQPVRQCSVALTAIALTPCVDTVLAQTVSNR